MVLVLGYRGGICCTLAIEVVDTHPLTPSYTLRILAESCEQLLRLRPFPKKHLLAMNLEYHRLCCRKVYKRVFLSAFIFHDNDLAHIFDILSPRYSPDLATSVPFDRRNACKSFVWYIFDMECVGFDVCRHLCLLVF